ncbi:hypothetical protein Pmani_010221 [Petrolisthes manimaculis]|uniref:SCAN box domain-containing protein n=1 Tax=Petrolisthes manimaculis TaxID=1843537 RepID=A0AAE1UC66_9EUCA|nr:hypothetical protein Pmani_010221 [Petrolisthes manimaculis]
MCGGFPYVYSTSSEVAQEELATVVWSGNADELLHLDESIITATTTTLYSTPNKFPGMANTVPPCTPAPPSRTNPAKFISEWSLPEAAPNCNEDGHGNLEGTPVTADRMSPEQKIMRGTKRCFEEVSVVANDEPFQMGADVQWLELATHYELEPRAGQSKKELRQLVLQHMVEDDILAEEDAAALDKPSDLIILKRLQLQLAHADNEKLRLQLSQGSSTSEPPFRLSDALKFVPLFPEEDPDGFFISFERAAALHEWPEDKWVLLAHNSFRGKAQDVFRSLDSTITNDYHVVKKSILHAYQKVPEAYRQQFRSCRKAEGETYVEFFRRKQILCRKWVDSELVTNNFDDLLQLLVLEDVKSCIPIKIRSYLEERGINSLAEAGPSADHYALINPDLAPKNKSHVSPPYPTKQMSVAPVRPPIFRDTRDSHFVRPLVPVRPAGGVPHQNVGRELRPPPYCRYCKKPGHQIHECMKLASKNTSSPHGRVVLHTSVRPEEVELPQIPQVSEKLDLSPCSDSSVTLPSKVPPSFQPFCSSGRVAASCTINSSTPVTILRDTGSDLSCILKEYVPNFECYTGETVLVSGLPGTARQSQRLAEAPSEEPNDSTDDLFLGELFTDAIPAPLPTETHSNALPITREATVP